MRERLWLVVLLLFLQFLASSSFLSPLITLSRPHRSFAQMLSSGSSSSTAGQQRLRFDGLLWDCDGVIAETERDAHRVAFNRAFQSLGLSTHWDVDLYGELVRIGGGKERMTSFFRSTGWPEGLEGEGEEEEKRARFIKQLHKVKTEMFQSTVLSGVLPPRPGVLRLMDEALSRGVKVAICSTSTEAAVQTIGEVLLGHDRMKQVRVFAGDVVSKKKPAPDVYLLAARELQLDVSRCWVIEDSAIGLAAATAAGMRCLVTKSIYTAEEDFSTAQAVVNDLEDGIEGQKVTVDLLNALTT
eukprot:gene9077-10019_t